MPPCPECGSPFVPTTPLTPPERTSTDFPALAIYQRWPEILATEMLYSEEGQQETLTNWKDNPHVEGWTLTITPLSLVLKATHMRSTLTYIHAMLPTVAPEGTPAHTCFSKAITAAL